jgi:hypothetical protein
MIATHSPRSILRFTALSALISTSPTRKVLSRPRISISGAAASFIMFSVDIAGTRPSVNLHASYTRQEVESEHLT